MRREKVDPAEKLFNVFAQKVKKGRLWPPAGNEVEKVVSNLHFSSSHLIGHPHLIATTSLITGTIGQPSQAKKLPSILLG